MEKKNLGRNNIPAVFLDRDGVLNVEKGYITEIEQLELFPYARECIERIHKCGFLAIVISNQSAVGRGFITEDNLCMLNNYIKVRLELDAIYYCPHWYDEKSNFSEYNRVCDCRKPGVGLVHQAVEAFHIQLQNSYFVGDRDTDILTGKNVGIKTVLLKSGYKNWDSAIAIEPDMICENLVEFLQQLEMRKGVDYVGE